MCRNTCICCEDWECCKCRCCSRKNPKVVDKSSYDRRMAGQLFSQSPRAVDRRQRNVNERGLTILEHHGKDHKDHYEEEIYFNNQEIQMNQIGIGLINEFRLIHMYNDEYDPDMKIIDRSILPPNDKNFAFDPWHIDGTLHQVKLRTDSKEYVGLRSTFHNIDTLKALDIGQYKIIKKGIRQTLANFDALPSNRIPSFKELGFIYNCFTCSLIPECIQKLIPSVIEVRNKKYRIYVNKMHALTSFLEKVNQTIEFKEKNLQVHYINIGSLEGLCFSLNPFMCNGEENLWWSSNYRPIKKYVYNKTIAKRALSTTKTMKSLKDLLLDGRNGRFNNMHSSGKEEDLDGYIGNRRYVYS